MKRTGASAALGELLTVIERLPPRRIRAIAPAFLKPVGERLGTPPGANVRTTNCNLA